MSTTLGRLPLTHDAPGFRTVHPTRNWIFWALCLIPLLNGASLEVTLAMVALGYWAFDDSVCVLPLFAYVLTHAKGWAWRIVNRVKMKRWERQRIKERQEWEQAHEVARQRRLEEDRIKQTAEEARIAALPPPPPPPPEPTTQEMLDCVLRDFQSEKERINAAYPADSPQWRRRMNEAEREYDQNVQLVRSRARRKKE